MSDKHLVFLVHGIGLHKEGWSAAYQKQLVDLAGKYSGFAGKTLLDDVEFCEVTYDKIFDDQIQSWENNFDNLITDSPPGSEQSVREALEWMDGMSEQKDNFLWTHVADAVLWKISAYLRNHVITRVARIVAEGIDRKISESAFSPKYSIIGHSMGTSVVHQSLAALASGAWSGDGFNAFNAGDVRFRSIHMIANVGHYFEPDPDEIYRGIVRPGIIDGMHGYCRKYFNYNNRFDPICWAGRFSPGWTVDDGFHDIPVSHLHSRDVHDISHYLANPKVHIPLIRSISSVRRIGSQEELDAIADFRQIGGEVEDEVSELKAKLDELKGSINEFKDLGSWIKGWSAYGQLK
jgi:hypothetical protein